MHKPVTWTILIASCQPLLATLVTAAAVGLAGPSDVRAAQVPPGGTAATVDLPDLTEIQQNLTDLRGLKFLKNVPAEYQSMEEWGAYLDKELATMFPPDKVDGFMAGLVRLGMLKEPIDLGKEFKNALLSQAGAYYDPPSGKFFYLMTDMAPQFLQTVAAHELVHALQDQHFDLGAVMKTMEAEATHDVRNDDLILAIRFLVEGEATYVQTLWQMKIQMGMDLSANRQMERTTFSMQANLDPDAIIALSKQMDAAAMGLEDGDIAKAIDAMDSIPPYILHPLLAAYLKGAYFVMSVRHDGGWEGVAEAYKTLPVTSEQVMHPEKYTGTPDLPTPLTLPELEYVREAGWKPIDSAIHGEFYLALMLDNAGCPGPLAKRATAGWDGDLYRAYQHTDGRVMFVLATTWDSEKDATEFFKAYTSILRKKCDLPKPGSEYIEASGDVVYPAGAGDDDTGRLTQRGREVFVVEGAPAELASRIITSLKSIEVQHVD